MCDSNDCLSQELQEIDKVLSKEANKKKELSELKNEIEQVHKSRNEPKEEKLEEKLRGNLHDQISLMNVDQMAEVHNWLKHSDMEDIEKI